MFKVLTPLIELNSYNKCSIVKTMVACLLLSSSLSVMADRAQYGFWHRVNDADYINDALDTSDPEGLEIDICYETSDATWYVNHYDSSYCYLSGKDTLSSWLSTFKNHIENHEHYHLSALWLDIKTPNLGDLKDVVNLVRGAKLNQSEINVIYDLGDVSTLTGFHRIKGDLQWNEGIGFWANSKADVATIYNLYKANDLVKGMVHSGHSANIDESYIDESQDYLAEVKGAHGFKKNFTWTNSVSTTMEYYMVPDTEQNTGTQCRDLYNCYTNGQIVGTIGPFLPTNDDDMYDFHRAIDRVNQNNNAGVYRATKEDEFWGGWSLNPTLISVVM